jgi:hypothetical protein
VGGLTPLGTPDRSTASRTGSHVDGESSASPPFLPARPGTSPTCVPP